MNMPFHEMGGEKKNVLMFHVGRSGSSVLGDLLNQHPHINWKREIYLTLIRQQGVSDSRQNQTSAKDLLKRKLLENDSYIFGAEVKFFHLRLLKLELAEFLRMAKELEIEYFIVLRRLNLLRKIVSSLIAHQTNVWHVPANEETSIHQIIMNTATIEIDRSQKSLVAFLKEYEADFQKLYDLLVNEKVLQLDYEFDLLENPTCAYRRICDFLNLPVTPVEIRYSRTNPYKLPELIANFQEVEKALRETSFEWMLYD